MKKIILIVSIALTTLTANAGNIKLANYLWNTGYLLLNNVKYIGNRQDLLDIAYSEGYKICDQPNDVTMMYLFDTDKGYKSIFYQHADQSWWTSR